MNGLRRLFSKKTDESSSNEGENDRYEHMESSKLKTMSHSELIKIIYRYDDDALILNSELEEAFKTIETLKKTVKDYQERLKSLAEKNQEDSLRKELEELQKKYTDRKQEISLLKEENTKHRSQKDSILGEIKFINNRLNEKEKDLSELELKLIDRKHKISKLKEKHSQEIKEVKESFDNQKLALNNQIHSLETELKNKKILRKENSFGLFDFKASLEEIHQKVLQISNKSSDLNSQLHSSLLTSIEIELNNLITIAQVQLDQPKLFHRRKFSAVSQSEIIESKTVKHVRQLSNNPGSMKNLLKH